MDIVGENFTKRAFQNPPKKISDLHEQVLNATNKEGRCCSSCKIWKQWNNFDKKGSRKSSRCKQCISTAKKQTYRRNKKRRSLTSKLRKRKHIRVIDISDDILITYHDTDKNDLDTVMSDFIEQILCIHKKKVQ